MVVIVAIAETIQVCESRAHLVAFLDHATAAATRGAIYVQGRKSLPPTGLLGKVLLLGPAAVGETAQDASPAGTSAGKCPIDRETGPPVSTTGGAQLRAYSLRQRARQPEKAT